MVLEIADLDFSITILRQVNRLGKKMDHPFACHIASYSNAFAAGIQRKNLTPRGWCGSTQCLGACSVSRLVVRDHPLYIYIWRFPKISKIAPVFSIINKPSSYGGTSISGNPQMKVQQWIGRTDRSSDAKASTARLAASSVPPQDFVAGGMHPVWGDQQQNTAFLCYSWNKWEYSGHWIDLISWKNLSFSPSSF